MSKTIKMLSHQFGPTVAKYVNGKFGELETLKSDIDNLYVDVRKFGEIGAGVDKETIQAAFDSDYDICFQPGIYHINGKVTLSKSKRILCKPGSIITVTPTVGQPAIEITATGFDVDGLALKGLVPYYERTDDASDTVKYNNYWDNRRIGGIGISIRGTKGTLKNCEVSYVTLGILNQFSDNVLIDNCHVHHTMADAFPIYHAAKRITIRNCLAEHNGDDAYPVFASLEQTTEACEDITIESNRSYYCYARAYLCHGGKNVTFSNNKSYYAKLGALRIQGNDDPTHYSVKDVFTVKAIDNTFYVDNLNLTTVWHVYITNATDVKIRGNSIFHKDVNTNNSNMLVMMNKVYDAKVEGNTFDGDGIQVGISSDNVQIVRNTFKNCNTLVARLVDSNNVTFSNNTSENTQVSGQIVRVGTSGSTALKGIIILDNNLDNNTGTVYAFKCDGIILNADQLYYFYTEVTNVEMRGNFKGTSLPAAENFKAGTMFYNTTDSKMYIKQASTWAALTVA